LPAQRIPLGKLQKDELGRKEVFEFLPREPMGPGPRRLMLVKGAKEDEPFRSKNAGDAVDVGLAISGRQNMKTASVVDERGRPGG